MAIISATQFKLTRARRSLERAYHNKDWNELRQWDTKLAECLNLVFEDPGRDTKSLLNELEYILKMYSRILAELPEDSSSPHQYNPFK
ncbi:hypothetical protein [Agarilytica rhodophyticola]|uniref:hypothetical protein n=1 Tax=Agarilytica rhodophyticola TaxID=1737490 RepID=UPI000B348634|nr:hypothetical protein [Agarilytica rhodophyticola]